MGTGTKVKVAVLMAGQTRGYDSFEHIMHWIVRPLNADVYFATWEGVTTDKAVAAFSPKKHVLLPPDSFVEIKQAFWDRYKTMQSDQKILGLRLQYLQGELKNRKYDIVRGDNSMRMFYLNSQVMSLVDEPYDCLIKVRPDLRVSRFMETFPSTLEKNCIYSPAEHNRNDHRAKFTSDQIFYGEAEVVAKTMRLWDGFARFMYTRIDSNTEIPTNAWIHPEGLLKIHIEKECGGTIVPLPFGCRRDNPGGDPNWVANLAPIVKVKP